MSKDLTSSQSNTQKHKLKVLFLILSSFFVANAILAEVIGVKIFSLEKTLGLAPANIRLLADFVLNFNLTAGVIIWPVVFISTDVINEYFGKRGVRQVSIVTAVIIAYMFLVLTVIMHLVPADFWLAINSTDGEGNSINIDFAFNAIFRQGLGIIVGSITAFLLGQFLDAVVFQKLKQLTGDKKIWLRATGSTLISQLIDSFVVLFIAFYFLAPQGKSWSVEQVISVAVINYIYKFAVAVILTPVIYLVHFIIDRYLGKSFSQQIREEALTQS